MSDYLLFIDTETSDIPRRWNAPAAKEKKWPYILQISWLIYTNNGQLIKSEDHYIDTGNIKISRQSQQIHGITLDLLTEMGKERKEVIALLKSDFQEYQPMVVGHFLEFDHKMLDVGFFRAGIENILSNLPQFCTMKVTLGLDGRKPGQLLRLSELHKLLFGDEQDMPHNALYDALATANCYFELEKRGIITPEVIAKQQLKRQARNNLRSSIVRITAILTVIVIVILGVVLIINQQ